LPIHKQLETQHAAEPPLAVKIVSQGLMKTEPRYVSKMIYMIRHPRQVAKSQERLERNMGFTLQDGTTVDPLEEDHLKVHTPEMYNRVTVTAARWLKAFPDVAVLFVEFDDLVSDPANELARIGAFLGEDLSAAESCINAKLKRSEPEDMPSELWGDAEAIYERFKAKDWDGVIAVLSTEKSKTVRQKAHFPCFRTRLQTHEPHCKACMADPEFRASLIKYATEEGIDWRNEPCAYECGMDPDNDAPKTISESVENSHWVATTEQ